MEIISSAELTVPKALENTVTVKQRYGDGAARKRIV
jgi:hypothetical protein